MYLLDDNGEIVDSEFSLDVDSRASCVVVESSGGSNPGTGILRRNPDYNILVNTLLQRICATGAFIARVVLDSKPVAGLPIEDRIAMLDREYPIDLKGVDADDLRRMIGRTVAGMHRSHGAKSRGNAQKRIRICLDRIIDPDLLITARNSSPNVPALEEHAPGISETERECLSKARVGQGRFRNDLLQRHQSECPLTGITHPDLLVASHIKPWKVCTNLERLDPENGILFSGLIDRLFDSGLITFDSSGCIVVSSKLAPEDVERCGLNDVTKLSITASAQRYMEYHRSVQFHP